MRCTVCNKPISPFEPVFDMTLGEYYWVSGTSNGVLKDTPYNIQRTNFEKVCYKRCQQK